MDSLYFLFFVISFSFSCVIGFFYIWWAIDYFRWKKEGEKIVRHFQYGKQLGATHKVKDWKKCYYCRNTTGNDLRV